MAEQGYFGLFGTGGCARSIMPFVPDALRAALGAKAGDMEIVFVDRQAGPPVNGVRVMAQDVFLSLDAERYFNVGIAEGGLRRVLAGKAMASGARPVSLVAPSAQVFAGSEIGEGAVICANAIVTVNVRIGRFVHINLLTYVEHDCRIGDFVTFAPAACCNGAIEIGDEAYIGSGAVIRQGSAERPMRIGAKAVVGMGAVVTRSVGDGVTVMGNPARPDTRSGAD